LKVKLSAHNLTLIRGESCLFKDLSFTLNSGELLVLEGQNGSGKTSLIRAILGMLNFESGEIFWNDISIKKQRQEFHRSIIWLSHRAGLKKDLTLLENLSFECSLRSKFEDELSKILKKLNIFDLKDLPIRSMSAGQQRRVALARLLLFDAPIWLLDEPFTNLDDEGQAIVLDLINSHLSSGGICVIAAHQEFNIDATKVKVKL
tara:strand:- start:2813 stop:3424 length:612 start_codon:yes stop_codon:yes gene_type:complete